VRAATWLTHLDFDWESPVWRHWLAELGDGHTLVRYLAAYGESAIAGVDLVGAAARRTPSFEHIGPGLLEHAGDACGPDLPTSIAAMLRFLRACTVRPLSDHDSSMALAWNMVVPSEVRGALFARELDADDVLSRLSVPVLVTHGLADAIVLPSMAEHLMEVCGTARASWYEDVGHLPFLEDSDRFDRELAELAG
jgi:non-heme chloroperoxidase